ncbi:LOW QUALITY PROTEIN: hypothetical protein V2J09_018270 [Rumex salicifolius]
MSLSLRDRVKRMFSKLGHTVPEPPVIYCDNMGATSPSVNLVFHSIMKHIALAYHFVPDNWVLSLFFELGRAVPNSPVIYCDYMGATSLSANPVFHSWIKHIALAYHFVCENKITKVAYVSTNDQLADVLTKPLLRPWSESIIVKFNLSF